MKTELSDQIVDPLHDLVLVLPEEKINRRGAIMLPKDAEEMTYKATVIAIGPGRIDNDGDLVPMGVKVGDLILHKSYGVTAIEWDGEEHFLLEERNILGVIRKGKK